MREKDQEIYNYIVEYAIKNGCLPTIREIGDGVGLKSTSSVEHHMNRLQNRGFITREWGGKRYTVKGLRYTLDE